MSTEASNLKRTIAATAIALALASIGIPYVVARAVNDAIERSAKRAVSVSDQKMAGALVASDTKMSGALATSDKEMARQDAHTETLVQRIDDLDQRVKRLESRLP